MSVLAKNVQRREGFLEAHAPKALESVARVRSSPRAKTISGLVSMKDMIILKLPRFFPHYKVREKLSYL